ncbi:MAG: DivIVA domain-containing protein [Actinomycetota bacterium]
MPDSERRQRVISSTPRLSPEDIANRAFAKGVRGYSEAEVRSFLRRISEEFATVRDREHQLIGAIDDLEQQLRAPQPLDEQQLLDALGEETARLLRSAREAADDIRKKAEDRASRLMEEAQAEAHRLRTDAAEILGTKSHEAEAHAAEIVGEADARATEVREHTERTAEEQRLRAENEAEAIVEGARQQGREMLDEVRSARERVLADLGRRRGLLQAQVEELRQGRDRLLDAYRVVKRTFLDATEALSQIEARAAAGRPLVPTDTNAHARVDIDLTNSDPGPHAGGVDAAAPGLPTDDSPSAGMAAVDSLFARLRAGQADGEAAEPVSPDATVADAVSSLVEATPAAPDGPTAWRRVHAEGAAGLIGPLVKRAKRAAQDHQNTLLDAVRRHKGRPVAAQVLPDTVALVEGWIAVLQDSLGAAYGAGRIAAGGSAAPPPHSLLHESAEAVALPLRDRFAAAIDDVDEGDTSGLVERIGARYREWKNQQLEDTLADMVVAAWSRGVYDAAPEDAVLQWIPLPDRRCADCDDNALEPTVKGMKFPTGQEHPPAHPGCRCLLAPVEVLATVTG